MSLYGAARRWFDAPPEAAQPLDTSTRGESALRADAERILHAAIEAVDPERRTVETLHSHQRAIPLEGRVWVAAFGRAAGAMARGAHAVLGDRVEGGVVIVPHGTNVYISPRYDVFRGGHPVPDEASVAGARSIRQMAREAEEADVLLCLVSGGGSSLLTLPPEDMPLSDVQTITEMLARTKVRIEEMSCVRKHLDQLKGGQLVREAAPARVLALVLSDVPGDPLDVVASGPFAPDPSRFADAAAVLKRHGIRKELPLAARGWLDRGVCGEIEDTPDRNDPLFLRTTSVIIGNGEQAARAACEAAEGMGYDAQILSVTLGGSGAQAGGFLAETARVLAASREAHGRPLCVIATGARGQVGAPDGRNQALALAAAEGLAGLEAVLVASMASDGIDDDQGAAGAIVTGTTASRAARAGFELRQTIERNEAARVLTELDDRIESGPTTTHVGDIQVMLLGRV
jgi:hydroxypyruvate reductase